MQRGQFVIVATTGDYGKPRPALIIQSNLFADLPSITLCPLTTTLRNDANIFRLDVLPTKENGLREASQIAIDKITTVPIIKIGGVIGICDSKLMAQVNRAIILFLGLV